LPAPSSSSSFSHLPSSSSISSSSSSSSLLTPSSPSLPSVPAHKRRAARQLESARHVKHFWAKQRDELERAASDGEKSLAAAFSKHDLPLARIKKIMKSDDEVRMISAEVPVLFSKACELFILELTLRAWAHTSDTNRRTLQRNDVADAILEGEGLDFLVDIVPRVEEGPNGTSATMASFAPNRLDLKDKEREKDRAENKEGENKEAEKEKFSTQNLVQKLQKDVSSDHLQALKRSEAKLKVLTALNSSSCSSSSSAFPGSSPLPLTSTSSSFVFPAPGLSSAMDLPARLSSTSSNPLSMSP